MTNYRRYKAGYTFDKRSGTELSMAAGETLLVQMNLDGSWPPPEKWMQGFNEQSGESGEFPGGQYVEFVEEFCNQPDPQPALPEKEPEVQAPPPIPSPRHGSADVAGSTYNGGRKEEELDDSPPPPPPPRRSIGNVRAVHENHVSGSHPPQTVPRPVARKPRKSVDIPDKRHNWVKVTFRIPVQCAGCKLQQRMVA